MLEEGFGSVSKERSLKLFAFILLGVMNIQTKYPCGPWLVDVIIIAYDHLMNGPNDKQPHPDIN